jgi:hypothetical protein
VDELILFTSEIALGQLVIAATLGVVSFFIKRELNIITTRLDKHDDMLFSLIRDVARLIGAAHLADDGKRKL